MKRRRNIPADSLCELLGQERRPKAWSSIARAIANQEHAAGSDALGQFREQPSLAAG